MDFTLLSSILSALLLAVFLGIVYWAYSGSNRQRFQEDGLLPFDEEGPLHSTTESEEALRHGAFGGQK